MSGRENAEREEDNQKTKCSSKALGLVVAAGVGIGAALYFYCNRRPQGPDTSGATTSGWTCERANQLSSPNSIYESLHTRISSNVSRNMSDESDSYVTVSEFSTSDTSINSTSAVSSPNWNSNTSDNIDTERESDTTFAVCEDIVMGNCSSSSSENDCTVSENDSDSSENDSTDSDYDPTNLENDPTDSESDFIMSETDTERFSDFIYSENEFTENEDSIQSYVNNSDVNLSSDNDHAQMDIEESDSEVDREWDVISHSVYVPNESLSSTTIGVSTLMNIYSSRHLTQQENSLKALKEAAFRRRSWTLEECSICFEVMLVDQELMALQCTHNFHTQCILPWLQEKQTCPVCRENAD